MALFQITPFDGDNSEKIKSSLIGCELDFYRLERGEFFVKFPGTVKELSEKIKLTADGAAGSTELGRAVVVTIDGWWGYGPKDVWDWLKSRSENG